MNPTTEPSNVTSGGSVTWACTPGFPPIFIFPFADPGHFGIRNLFEFQALMYRPLYWFGTNGEPTVDYNLSLGEPPEWSADGRTATITIKPYEWSNGEKVDAGGVMFWMHLLEVEKANYGGYVPGYFPDNLSSYEAVAEDKVRFTFDRAYSQRWVLMNQLSLITPLPKAWDRTAAGVANCTEDKADASAVYAYLMEQNADKESFASSPIWSVVNGPWRLSRFSPYHEAVFTPNRRYSGPNKPKLAEFRQVASESDETQFEALTKGPDGPGGIQVGFLPFDCLTEPTNHPMKGGPHPLSEHYTLIPQITYSVHYFPLNFNNPTVAGCIFRQLYFRQALQSTIDQQTAIRDIYKGYGYETTGPIPTLPGSDLVSPRQLDEHYPFDIERARALLTANGWDVSATPGTCINPGTGPGQAGEGIALGDRLTFSMRYVEGHRTLTRFMETFRSAAADAGIEIVLSEVDGDALAAEDTTCTPGPDSPCLWEMSDWNGGWVYGPGFYPTGEFLYKTGSGVNFGSYSDAEADALIDRTVTSDDPSALWAYQEHIAEQAPVMWMPNFPLRLLEVANGLRGVEPINPFGLINPENWYYAEPK